MKKECQVRADLKTRISKIINAIYYYDLGNIHRPNKNELSTGFFNCPKCKSKLSVSPKRIINKIYICPCCGFKISYEKVLNSQDEIVEYQMREENNG